MEKVKNNNKKVIILILVISIVVVSIVVLMLSLNKKRLNNSTGDVNSNENTILPSGESYDGVDISLRFLKMENNKKNMIYSPLSIKYALAMLNEGASGNTKKQISDVIGNDSLTKYDNIDKVLSLANAMYIRNEYFKNIKDSYKDTLVSKYNAEVKKDAFKNAKNINEWISKKTFKRINNIVKDSEFDNPELFMILINALAIDMKWVEKFDPKDTTGSTFYLEDGSTIDATMMYQKTRLNNISYYKDEKINALALDLEKYKDTQLEYLVIMPENDLYNYVNGFSMESLKEISNNLVLASNTENGLEIYMPRFSFEYDLDLDNDLKRSGIVDAFDKNLATFSNISSNQLYVGKTLHRANIDFTEKGIKAAATTVIETNIGALFYDKPINITINKPFMFFIRDKKTGEIWFSGTVYRPNEWENDKKSYRKSIF